MSQLTLSIPFFRSSCPANHRGGADANRFWEFFAANIRNKHTRRAYGQATGLFWCENAGVASIADAKPLHVLRPTLSSSASIDPHRPTVKQHLATLVGRRAATFGRTAHDAGYKLGPEVAAAMIYDRVIVVLEHDVWARPIGLLEVAPSGAMHPNKPL
jgi:hypothetical protein